MRKLSFASLVVVSLAGSALAQPGQDPAPAPAPAPYPEPPPQPQPYPQPYPAPQPLPPPGYVPPNTYYPVQLSADDQALLQKGEISEGAHVGGVVTSLLFGFGVGQAVQGRYSETGWIFTLGEAASFAALMYGVLHNLDCSFDDRCDANEGVDGIYIVGGLIGLLGFRVWEIVDAVGGPSKHNRKVRELKMRLGIPVPMYTHKVIPYINKTRDGGGTAGLLFRF